MATPLVNGVNYSWSNITVVLFGVPIVGITEVAYTSKQKKENNYGVGTAPVSRGYGNEEFEGSITMYLDEWIGIQNAAPGKNPLQIAPFNVSVVYGGSRVTAKTDIIRMAEFLENPLKSAQGDGKVLVTIPLIIGGIDYNV